ncbi:hypothetical protein [Citrobacter farmeri]
MTMKKTKEELTSLFNMYYEIETTEEKLAFARENLFLDKKALSKSFNLITNKEEKLDFIDEYIENSTLRFTTYTENTNQKTSFKNEFVIAFTDNLEKLAFELNVSNAELRVITYILKRMEFGNLISLKQNAIAEKIGMKTANMSVIFKKLKQKKILIEDEDKNLYMNANIFAKGLNHKMKKEKRDSLNRSKISTDIISQSF